MSLSQATGIRAPAVFEEVVEQKPSSRWLLIPLALSLVGMLLATLLRSGTEYLVTALLAYANCLLGGIAIAYFLRQHTLASIIPLLFLSVCIMAGSVSTVYLAIMAPEVAYYSLWGMEPLLSGGVRYQGALLLFHGGYLLVLFALVRKRVETTPVVATDSAVRFAKLMMWTGCISMGIHASSKLLPLPWELVYLCEGMYLYLHCLFFSVGAMFTYLSKKARIGMVVYLMVLVLFYTLGNARGMAVAPFLYLVAGLFFVSRVSPRKKTLLLITLALMVPLYLVAANVTRERIGSVGWADLGARFEALKQWREYLRAGPVMDRFFSRMFFRGAHSIITMSPETVPYMDFSLPRYVGELVTRILIPGAIYYKPYYSTTGVLLNYGILITASTSVEVSIPGSLWMLGGVVPLAIGALVLGVFLSWLAHRLTRANARSPLRGLFYLTMLSSVMIEGSGADIILFFRTSLVHFLAAFLLYHLFVKRVIGEREGVLDLVAVPGGTAGP